MIPLAAVLSTSPVPKLSRRALLLTLPLAGCANLSLAPPAPVRGALPPTGAFRMTDGALLPFRHWLPPGKPAFAALALHGFNDSRDAWEIPAVDLAAAGIAVYAPDQRGFGEAAGRGIWPGTETLVADAAEMARQVRQRHPDTPLLLLGESMGGAVLMCLATGPAAPAGARYALAAPAVWGRGTMNVGLRILLWLAATALPGLSVTGAPVRVTASDNRAALIRLSRDPLTLHSTRFDAVRGLVDLMDAALAAAPAMRAEALFLYGGHDELVPTGAMAAMWRRLPEGGARPAYYPRDYHLILRDLGRAVPLGDIIAWTRHPNLPLPSGADRAARAWLAGQG